MNNKIKIEFTFKTLALVLGFITYLILLANSLIFKKTLLLMFNDHYMIDENNFDDFYGLYQYLNITFYIILGVSIFSLITILIVSIINRKKGDK